MELRLGLRITQLLVILVVTFSSETVEAQRAGEAIKIKNSDATAILEHL